MTILCVWSSLLTKILKIHKNSQSLCMSLSNQNLVETLEIELQCILLLSIIKIYQTENFNILPLFDDDNLCAWKTPPAEKLPLQWTSYTDIYNECSCSPPARDIKHSNIAIYSYIIYPYIFAIYLIQISQHISQHIAHI